VISLHYDVYSFISQYVCFDEKHPVDFFAHSWGDVCSLFCGGGTYPLSEATSTARQDVAHGVWVGCKNAHVFCLRTHMEAFLEWFLEEIVSRFCPGLSIIFYQRNPGHMVNG